MILAELSHVGPRPWTGSSPSSSWLAADEMDALEFILQTGRKRPLQHRRLPQQHAAWFQSQRLADKSKKRKEIKPCHHVSPQFQGDALKSLVTRRDLSRFSRVRPGMHLNTILKL